MFGLSVSKILLLALIVGAVVVGTRVLGRIGQDKAPAKDKAPKPAPEGTPGGGSDDGAVDMVQCPSCGVFHPPGKHTDCGRTGGG